MREGVGDVFDLYAKRTLKDIEENGYFVRVADGKEFYVYVLEAVDPQKASIAGVKNPATPAAPDSASAQPPIFKPNQRMNVRITFLFFTLLLTAGCAMQPTGAQSPSPMAAPVVVAAVLPTKLVETRYDVRGYLDAANPSLRHEAHAIYRRTRVPLSASDELATMPRSAFPPASVAPLPASEELSAELTTQRKITAELRAMQAALADAEKQMTAQYALLVQQSAETMQVRGQLEAERARVRSALPVETAPAEPTGVTSATQEVKW